MNTGKEVQTNIDQIKKGNQIILSTIGSYIRAISFFVLPISILIGIILFLNEEPLGIYILYSSVALIILSYLYIGIRINLEFERSVIFRFGRIRATRGQGIIWIFPFIDKRVQFDVRIVTVDIDEQKAVTNDGVAIAVDAVLLYKVEEPAKTAALIQDYHDATVQMALTTLRDIIGQHNLVDVLGNRGKLNNEMLLIIEQDTAEWGIHIDSIKIKDISIPEQIIEAMSRSAQAEKERDARLIEIEAEVKVIIVTPNVKTTNRAI